MKSNKNYFSKDVALYLAFMTLIPLFIGDSIGIISNKAMDIETKLELIFFFGFLKVLVGYSLISMYKICGQYESEIKELQKKVKKAR